MSSSSENDSAGLTPEQNHVGGADNQSISSSEVRTDDRQTGENFRFGSDDETRPPEPLGEAAYHGLAREVVRRFERETEADPIALLLIFLVLFGNIIGRSAHFIVSGVWHGANLFLGLVGATVAGRKGTAWGALIALFRLIDPDYCDRCISSGLSSGEGLIQSVSDPVDSPNVDRRRHGIIDKRRFILEEEFGRALKAMQRQGNTLSPLLRLGWDGKTLQTLTKNPMIATDPHITLNVQITKTELSHNFSTIESAGGLGNRFLWPWVKRSKFLPDGGNIDKNLLEPLVGPLQAAIQFASQVGEVVRTKEADELWREIYPRLSAERPGLYGALTARAAPQVLRLAMIYALLDHNDFIRPQHLLAALEIIRYCDDSVRFIFTDRIGDPIADRILEALRDTAPAGLTRSEISEVFHRNRSQNEIENGLEILRQHGLATWREEATSGRSIQRWFSQDAPVVIR
jgi:hypothetical protein